MPPAQLFPALTRSRCDCCGELYTDPVGDLVIWDAVYAYREALEVKARRDRAAWSEAERLTKEALK